MQFQTISLSDIPEQSNDYALLPPGDYIATIKDAEHKHTKSGSGEYIKVKLEIVALSNAGRVLFSNINIRNDNTTAQNIGLAQLGQIMRAGGLKDVSNSEQLIGITVGIKVTIKDAQNGYSAQNEVKAFKPAGNAPELPQAAHVASATAPAAPKGTPPWAARK